MNNNQTGNSNVAIGFNAGYNHPTTGSNNKLYIQSGAGIVADSIPEKEYLETVNKAKALINSLN